MQHEREIDALLSREMTGSIIDHLFAIPPGADSLVLNEWDRAVASRFETHLAEQMRARIHTNGETDDQT